MWSFGLECNLLLPTNFSEPWQQGICIWKNRHLGSSWEGDRPHRLLLITHLGLRTNVWMFLTWAFPVLCFFTSSLHTSSEFYWFWLCPAEFLTVRGAHAGFYYAQPLKNDTANAAVQCFNFYLISFCRGRAEAVKWAVKAVVSCNSSVQNLIRFQNTIYLPTEEHTCFQLFGLLMDCLPLRLTNAPFSRLFATFPFASSSGAQPAGRHTGWRGEKWQIRP